MQMIMERFSGNIPWIDNDVPLDKSAIVICLANFRVCY